MASRVCSVRPSPLAVPPAVGPISPEHYLEKIIDPLDDTANYPLVAQDIKSQSELGPAPILETSISTHVWLAAEEVAKFASVGAFVGGCAGMFKAAFLSGWNPPALLQAGKDGAKVGGLVGGSIGVWSVFNKTCRVKIRIKTELAELRGRTKEQIDSFNQKANRIFQHYLKKRFSDAKDKVICPETQYLYIYPVKAKDGKVYEHSAIYHRLTTYYPKALEAYRQKMEESPDDPNIEPPFSSFYRSRAVLRTNELELDPDKMLLVSRTMCEFFRDLRKLVPIVQKAVDEDFKERFAALSLLSSEEGAFHFETLSEADEQVLAEKIGNGSGKISREELYQIYELFRYYLVQIKERDSRVYFAIRTSLDQQLAAKVISAERHSEEVQNLDRWFKKAKELYKGIV